MQINDENAQVSVKEEKEIGRNLKWKLLQKDFSSQRFVGLAITDRAWISRLYGRK